MLEGVGGVAKLVGEAPVERVLFGLLRLASTSSRRS